MKLLQLKQRTNELKCLKKQLQSEIETRQKIEEQFKKLSIVIEQIPSSTVIVDVKGNIEYVNPKFTQITGYSSEEVMGHNPHILKSGLHNKEFYNNMWDNILNNREWRGEFHNQKKDGTLYWESASISTIKNTNNKITNFIKVAEDITERKQSQQALQESEERFRSLFECAPDAIFLINKKSDKIIDANPAASKLLLKSYEEIIGLNQFELHPALLDKITEEVSFRYGKLTQNEQVALMEYVVIRSDGVEVPVEISTSTVYIRGKP
ncbi:PAS domain S-box protein, partial [Thiotrichales bacterium HSG1]|nr:PAS domain S-box protein [Thiotrichales bacterium HSG1]